jgi:Protein of unknown function (DUF3375)
MDFDTVEMLRERHTAWRLLRAQNASLVLSFLGAHFVEGNRGATPEHSLVGALDGHLELVNGGAFDPPFPRSSKEYLDSWSAPESGWLRRFYPHGSDEVHYDATPAFEKAYSWVTTLRARPFVGTESRLHTVVELLRQIVHGTETDQESRLERLREQRKQLDHAIRDAEQGNFEVLSETAVRDRYQQFAGTARELLSDFREVEDNFRRLDRGARERIAAWNGPKGELLAELVANRTDISSSDQGNSFQAFYDFLLSERRQDELAELLSRVQQIAQVDADTRLRTIHHDWSEAAERTQLTVRLISEQLRRFLDDQVWLENRRVLDIVRAVEADALGFRDEPPGLGLVVDIPGLPIALPFERPLYNAQPTASVQSMLDPAAEEEVDVSALFTQAFVDQARLAQNIRSLLPSRSSATLDEIIGFHPVEQGAAEIVGYLSLNEEDLAVTIDEREEIVIAFRDPGGTSHRARLPKVTVSRT